MNESDIDLQLFANEPIYVEGAGEITFPIVRDVIRLKESYYGQILSNLLIKKHNFENTEFANLDDFELFCLYCYHNEDFREVAYNGLRLFFGEEEITLEDMNKKIDGIPVCYIQLGKPSADRRIDINNFNDIQEIIAKANFLSLAPKEPEFKPVDDRAKAMIAKIMKSRKENGNVKKEGITLHSILAGLTWKPNGNSANEILDSTVYQVYMGYFVTQNIDSHFFTLTGIYTGNIDAKNISMSEFSWAKRV